jgi:hypothetical protein
MVSQDRSLTISGTLNQRVWIGGRILAEISDRLEWHVRETNGEADYPNRCEMSRIG